MAVALADYFREVVSSDVFDYGFGSIADFFKTKYADQSYDWVITNAPFRLAEQFAIRSMNIARRGVAMLTRTVFIESVGRYERLFKNNPPSRVAQFTERVPMVKGRVDKKASTATGYAWLVWERDRLGATELVWIPPCRKLLERDGDYQQAPRMPNRRGCATIIPMRKPGEVDLFVVAREVVEGRVQAGMRQRRAQTNAHSGPLGRAPGQSAASGLAPASPGQTNPPGSTPTRMVRYRLKA